MQALILAGGEGTRLRPLTTTVPKPVVPLAGRPHLAYMLEWLRGHGVDEAILSCGFMADSVRAVLGDGEQLGLRLRYVEEPEPLGTGGALKYAEELLEERFLMLNGDVLADLDLGAQLRQHETTGARATLALVAVEDPSAYGLVRLRPDGRVREFVEKPSGDEIDTNLINAGAYVLERSVLDGMSPAGTRASIERDVFPTLVGQGLYGHESSGYWLDIGTPERYLQGTFDILEGSLQFPSARRVAQAGGVLREPPADEVSGAVHPPALVGPECRVAADAVLAGRTVLGRGVAVQGRAHVRDSVLLDGCRIGTGAAVGSSIVCAGAVIGEGCRLHDALVGAGVEVGAGNVLTSGIRIFPGVRLPPGAIAF